MSFVIVFIVFLGIELLKIEKGVDDSERPSSYLKRIMGTSSTTKNHGVENIIAESKEENADKKKEAHES